MFDKEEEEEDDNDEWGQFILIDNNGELLTRLKNLKKYKQSSAHEQMSSFVVFCLFIFIFSVLV